MSARLRGRPFEPGRSGNPGGRPRVVGKLRELARAHAPQAIKELARLAVKAKSETARVAAIRELLDRGYGKATQFLAADDDIIRDDISAEELRAELFADFEQIFPEYEMVPRKRLTVIDGTNETT
jgi:hypothetical protein